MIHQDKTLYGLVAMSFITKKSVRDLLMDYIKIRQPHDGAVSLLNSSVGIKRSALGAELLLDKPQYP